MQVRTKGRDIPFEDYSWVNIEMHVFAGVGPDTVTPKSVGTRHITAAALLHRRAVAWCTSVSIAIFQTDVDTFAQYPRHGIRVQR